MSALCTMECKAMIKKRTRLAAVISIIFVKSLFMFVRKTRGSSLKKYYLLKVPVFVKTKITFAQLGITRKIEGAETCRV